MQRDIAAPNFSVRYFYRANVLIFLTQLCRDILRSDLQIYF